MQTRRTLLQSIGFTTAGALFSAPQAHGMGDTIRGEAPWWLLSPLTLKSQLEYGWSIQSLSPIQDGASILTIQRGMNSLRVHICLHDGKPKGIAYSELFDLIVMDHGRGVRPVPEELASALLLLADTMRENEWADVPKHQFDGIHRMMTHAERVRSFGASHLQ